MTTTTTNATPTLDGHQPAPSRRRRTLVRGAGTALSVAAAGLILSSCGTDTAQRQARPTVDQQYAAELAAIAEMARDNGLTGLSPVSLRPVPIDTGRTVAKHGSISAIEHRDELALAALAKSTEELPPPIGVELLTPRGDFTDDVSARIRFKLEGRPNRATTINMRDPSRTAVARITVQPGAHFPWHTHPGPVIVNVSAGELVYIQAKDCVERPYAAGTAFVDPGRGNVHTAFNPTDEVTVLVATFFEVPAEGPLTITEGIVPPEDCQIEVGAHSH